MGGLGLTLRQDIILGLEKCMQGSLGKLVGVYIARPTEKL